MATFGRAPASLPVNGLHTFLRLRRASFFEPADKFQPLSPERQEARLFALPLEIIFTYNNGVFGHTLTPQSLQGMKPSLYDMIYAIMLFLSYNLRRGARTLYDAQRLAAKAETGF